VIKVLRAFDRAHGMDREEFLQRWERHAELVLAVPGVRGYVQSPRAGRDEQSSATFDGISALWFDDEAAAARAAESPQALAARADCSAFIDRESMRTATASEHVVQDVPVGPDAVKLVFFFRRRVGLSPEVFRTHWREVHGPLVVQFIGGLRRYVQNYTVESAYADGRDPDFDGLGEAYLDDLAALDETETSPEHDLVRSDEPNFIDVNRVRHLVASERVVLAP
jgi:uncharacterized protein (TIGR02118 family)